VAFRFDHKLDAGLAAEVRQGIERRLARLRELAAAVREHARAKQWAEVWTRYEDAERVAVNVDLWIARGRAEAGARHTSSQRTKAGRAGNEARRRLAKDTIHAITEPAREYRRRHPDSPLSAVMLYLRNTKVAVDVSDPTLRRYLHTIGLT
jgi:hypothetical protein